MTEIAIEIAAPKSVVRTVLTQLKNGKIDAAVALFVETLTFKDHGLGLEFKDKQRLSKFFRKRRELYPDSILETETIFVRGDHVIMEWTLQTMVTELIYGGLSRKLRVSVKGASVVRTENGRVTEWTDYYDGRTSRRTALAAHFEKWVEA